MVFISNRIYYIFSFILGMVLTLPRSWAGADVTYITPIKLRGGLPKSQTYAMFRL